MPRTSTQRPPKYRHHKATGRAYVSLDGRDHYLGNFGTKTSRDAYDKLIAQWIQGGGHYRPDSQQEISVAEVMVAFVAHAKRYYRKHGKPTREFEMIVEVCRAIKPLYGRIPAVEFGPQALKVVRQVFVDGDVSRKHTNKQIDRIKRMFKWAAAEELIPADVPQALSMVAGLRRGRCEARESSPVLPVDDAVVDATLEHLPDVVADMVRFQRATGCRPEEVRIVRPCDIDRSSETWAYRPESHKTEHHERERVIYIGPKAQAVVLRYLARDSQSYCFRPCDSERTRQSQRHEARSTPLSCGNRPGSNRVADAKRKASLVYTKDSYGQAIRRACARAFPHPQLGYRIRSDFTEAEQRTLREWQKAHSWSPNQLRHTAATQIRREFGLEAAQVILGHSQADVTQLYAERDLAKGLEVARKIG